MKLKLLIGFFVISIILLYGCTSTPNENTQMPVKEVKVIASCDDSNPCTEDVFNQLTQQCEHTRLDHCCGDGRCDADERCDQSTHQTICAKDCPRECPAFLSLNVIGCSGECTIDQDSFIIKGNSMINMQIQNIGEISLNDVVSTFKCTKENGNAFLSTNGATTNLGMSMKDYFNEGTSKVTLSGTPYGKNKASYTLKFDGTPQENLNLQCDLYAGYLGTYITKSIKVKLSQV